MEKENVVSVWLGKFNSQKRFQKFIDEKYDKNGDVTSEFMNQYGIDSYDNQFLESLYDSDGLNYAKLEGASYFNTYKTSISKDDLENSNAIILLYNFEFTYNSPSTDKMKFIGAFEFVPDDFDFDF